MSGVDKVCGFPGPRQQFVEAVYGMSVDHACENITQIGIWFDVVQLRCLDQGTDCCPPGTTTITAREQMILAPEGHRTDRSFNRIGIEFDAAVTRRNPSTPGDYEVGYGRPPREHRFKKGEASRNPKGRPRGANRPAPDLVGVLLHSTTIRIQGKERKVPDLEAMILVMKDKALRGDHRAAKMVIDLMRDLDLIRPKETLNPPSVTIVFKTPRDKNNE